MDILSLPDYPTPATRTDVAHALTEWDAQEFEDACAKRGMCVFKLRSTAEWDETPQAKALEEQNVVDVREVGKARKKEYETGEGIKSKRPLQGVKVLDLSRVLAGPVAGRNLAGSNFFPG